MQARLQQSLTKALSTDDGSELQALVAANLIDESVLGKALPGLANALRTMSVKMPEEEITEVAREMYDQLGVETATDFQHYLAQLPILSFWQSKQDWGRRGSILSKLTQAHQILVDTSKERAQADKSAMDMTLDFPSTPPPTKA